MAAKRSASAQDAGPAGGLDRDTIAAVATPPGRGGIGIVRLSGPRALAIAERITGARPTPRHAALVEFRDADHGLIDRGIVLYFARPASFTGEDVVELHGHGGPVVMDLLLAACLSFGARMARAGEFSERAFGNGKIDLVQAEAIADLIASTSQAGARSAMRSLAGEFSLRIETLAAAILDLRLYVEAAIDFPEEEVDFLAEGEVGSRLDAIAADLRDLHRTANQGALLTEGLRLVIAGRPNAGKSSLLNRLARTERAIVTEVPGTTRDVLIERIELGGLPLVIVDTAGLRDSPDRVEQEGVRRARAAVAEADHVLFVFDPSESEHPLQSAKDEALDSQRLTLVENKADLSGLPVGMVQAGPPPVVRISALTGAGLDALEQHLKRIAGFRDDEGGFSARRRHLVALDRVEGALAAARQAMAEGRSGELVAEDLRRAHDALGEIVGEVTSDALLGEIFGRFCIGK